MHIKRVNEMFSKEDLSKGFNKLKKMILPKDQELGGKIKRSVKNGNYSDLSTKEGKVKKHIWVGVIDTEEVVTTVQWKFKILGKNNSSLDIEINYFGDDKMFEIKANSKKLEVSNLLINNIVDIIEKQSKIAKKKQKEENKIKMFKDFE